MFELYIKYLLEGIAVAIAAYFIPKKKVDVAEIIFIALSAAATFAILDIFAPKVGDGARKGAGFGIGANTVGWPGLERFEGKSDDMSKSDDSDDKMSDDKKKKWCMDKKKMVDEYNKKCPEKKEKFYGGSTDSSKSDDTKSTDSSKSMDSSKSSASTASMASTASTTSTASSDAEKKPVTSDEVSGYDENKAYASF